MDTQFLILLLNDSTSSIENLSKQDQSFTPQLKWRAFCNTKFVKQWRVVSSSFHLQLKPKSKLLCSDCKYLSVRSRALSHWLCGHHRTGIRGFFLTSMLLHWKKYFPNFLETAFLHQLFVGGVIWWGYNLPVLLLVRIGLFDIFNSEGSIAFPAPVPTSYTV